MWRVALLLLVACASEPPRMPASSGWERSEPELAELYDPSGRPLNAPLSHDVTVEADRWSTQSLGAEEPPAAPRPRRVGKRNIFLRNARLDNALRHLASEGKFNLVVEGEMSTPVTIELTRVEPYDAVMALADAHHLEVRYVTGIMIVGKGK